jgi:hypothetical protein
MLDRFEPVASGRETWSASDLRTFRPPVMVIWPAIGLVLGLAMQLSGWQHWAGLIWAVATVPVLVVLLIEIVVSLRRGDVAWTSLPHFRCWRP